MKRENYAVLRARNRKAAESRRHYVRDGRAGRGISELCALRVVCELRWLCGMRNERTGRGGTMGVGGLRGTNIACIADSVDSA